MKPRIDYLTPIINGILSLAFALNKSKKGAPTIIPINSEMIILCGVIQKSLPEKDFKLPVKLF